MQGLQEIWGIQNRELSWATAGYLGAINSGQTTCGMLIGSTVAIGLKTGREKDCFPLDDTVSRNKAVRQVKNLYRDFIDAFGGTDCRALTTCDFNKPEDQMRYLEEKIYKNKCFRFFYFVMNRFIELETQKAP